MAETRTQRADGRHVTEGTRHRKGYEQRLVQVVPIRSADLDVLQAIRRLVWRVHSLAMMAELDGLREECAARPLVRKCRLTPSRGRRAIRPPGGAPG